MPRRLAGLLVLALAALPAAAEDVIVLRNGREIRGRVLEERADAVKIDLGDGRMTFPRDQIREVRREAAAAGPAAAGEAAEPAASREENSLLYVDGENAGTRVFRATQLADGWLFEEELRFLDADGKVRREVRTLERADAQLRPLSFQVRETDGVADHRSLTGEVRGSRLHVVAAKSGEKETREVAVPDDVRLPFAARELFLRESRVLAGRLDVPVFDLREGALRPFSYREGGMRPLRLEDTSLQARVIVRRRGDATIEREWLAPDGTAALAEISGAGTLAIAATRRAVERMRDGDVDRVVGPGSAARTTYVDERRGWRIGKPDPTWTFERPEVDGTGALLVVRNEPLFATVDVMTDPDAPRTVKVEAAAESLLRTCRAVAPDFRVVKDGWLDRDGARVYWAEAAATTKGEATRTLARVHVHDGRVYRLLAACPAGAFDTLREDLEKILDSFRAE